MKNGDCMFGESCKYHHPLDRTAKEGSVKLTLAGLPRREVCVYDFMFQNNEVTNCIMFFRKCLTLPIRSANCVLLESRQYFGILTLPNLSMYLVGFLLS